MLVFGRVHTDIFDVNTTTISTMPLAYDHVCITCGSICCLGVFDVYRGLQGGCRQIGVLQYKLLAFVPERIKHLIPTACLLFPVDDQPANLCTHSGGTHTIIRELPVA